MTGTRHKIADVEDLPNEGSRVIAEIDGKEIAVFRVNGEFYGVLNYCCHQAGPLCEGELTGFMSAGDDGWEWEYHSEKKIINCPWHCWRFDITSGENIDDDRYSVPVYDVEQNDDELFVIL